MYIDPKKFNKLKEFMALNGLEVNDLFAAIKNILDVPTHTRKFSLTKTKIDEAYLWYNSNIE